MKIIQARIVDSTHLELSEPLSARPGETIEVSLADRDEDDPKWKDAAAERLLAAYDDQDAVYDQL